MDTADDRTDRCDSSSKTPSPEVAITTTASSSPCRDIMYTGTANTAVAAAAANANGSNLFVSISRTLNGDKMCDTDDLVHSDEDFDEIREMFDTKMPLIERWLRDHASQDIVQRLHETTVNHPTKLRTASVTSELFQQWLASSPVEVCVSLFDYLLE